MRDGIRERREREMGGGWRDEVEFTFEKGRWGLWGEATLANRVRSHPDVGERWYPELLAEIRREQAEGKEEGNERAAEEKDGGLGAVEQGSEIWVH